MNAHKKILLSLFLALSCTQISSAFIGVENRAQETFRISIYGDGCRVFDRDHYHYAPCKYEFVNVNQTAHLEVYKEENCMSGCDVFPKISYWWFGLSYVCKVRNYEVKICDGTSGFFLNENCPAHLKPGALILNHASALSLLRSYQITVLSGYGYFPRPYVECDITEL